MSSAGSASTSLRVVVQGADGAAQPDLGALEFAPCVPLQVFGEVAKSCSAVAQPGRSPRSSAPRPQRVALAIHMCRWSGPYRKWCRSEPSQGYRATTPVPDAPGRLMVDLAPAASRLRP